MNITPQRLRRNPFEISPTRAVLLLAGKLEAAATGVWPDQVRSLYLVQADALLNSELGHSVAASLETAIGQKA